MASARACADETIYADHAATTSLRPEVARVMARCREGPLGNPSSGHAWGRRARALLEDARESVAQSLGTLPRRVFFTRGGTEANNLAVLGLAREWKIRGLGAPCVVTSAVEHPAVFDAARLVAAEGGRHRVVEVFPDGTVDMDALREALLDRPAVVSCMWINNETGLALPVDEIGAECRARRVRFHTDAVQAAGKVRVSLEDAPVDLLTATGHKLCGPAGTGALVVADSAEVAPLHAGGGQERGLRPGTEDVAGAAGFAEALRLAVKEQPSESARLRAFRDDVEERLTASVPRLSVACAEGPRAPHITSLQLSGANSDTLLAALDAAGIAASGGSACASGSGKPSRALAALYPDTDAASIRLSYGRLTRRRHAGRIVGAVAKAVGRARALAAL